MVMQDGKVLLYNERVCFECGVKISRCSTCLHSNRTQRRDIRLRIAFDDRVFSRLSPRVVLNDKYNEKRAQGKMEA